MKGPDQEYSSALTQYNSSANSGGEDIELLAFQTVTGETHPATPAPQHTHARTRTRMHTHTHLHAHTHAHGCTYTHLHTRTHARTL